MEDSMKNLKAAVALALLFMLSISVDAVARESTPTRSPRTIAHQTREQRLEPRDREGWTRLVPVVVRRLIARVNEELTPPKP
jgi:hypothetical protein